MTPPHCIPYRLEAIEAALTALPLPNPPFLAAFLVGLLTCQKARFAKIANAMPGEARPRSQETRLRRYLDHPSLNRAAFARAMLLLRQGHLPTKICLLRYSGARDSLVTGAATYDAVYNISSGSM